MPIHKRIYFPPMFCWASVNSVILLYKEMKLEAWAEKIEHTDTFQCKLIGFCSFQYTQDEVIVGFVVI